MASRADEMRVPSGFPVWAEASCLLLAALSLRLWHLDHVPIYDELYHVLAGRSWALDGTLTIGDGEYRRASLFSMGTGLMFCLFGESLATARIIPVVAGAVLVVAVFLWTRSVAGRLTAWIAALLLATAPDAVALSQFIRFYTLHALLFFLGAIGVYTAVTESQWSLARRTLLLLFVLFAFTLAFHFQVTTLIGLAGIGAWLVMAAGPAWIIGVRGNPWVRRASLVCGVLALVALGIAFASGYSSRLWSLYRAQAYWAEGSKFHLYHWLFLGRYATFWSLLPVVTLIAVARRPRPGIFCASIVAVGLLLHSLGGMRGGRYVFYITPFLHVLFAIAIAEALPFLWRVSAEALAHLLPARIFPIAARPFQWGAMGAALLFLLASNKAFVQTFKIARDGPLIQHPGYSVNWPAASEALKPLLQEADVVVTTNALAALYYLNRFDYDMNKSHLYEIHDGEEFSIDRETGRPVISEPESLQRIISCYRSGLVVAAKWQWHDERTGISREAAELLQTYAEPVNLDPVWSVMAFTWTHARLPAADCSAIGRQRTER